MTEKSAAIVLDSSRSTQISLEAIREGNAGLNTHRQGVLDRAPEVGDSAIFKREALKLIDLAYLTAKTGHEFAILRGKDLDILFHGDFGHCEFPETIVEMLMTHKLEILGHSHPGEDDPVPSPGDRLALKRIGQKKSIVISGRTGRMKEYGQSPFEDYGL
jgi:hypothetical protein